MFFSRVASFAVIGAGIGLASAQTLSSQCETTLANVVLSSDSQCLNAQALVGVLTTASDASLVSPINSWLTGMCSQPACTNDTLASVVSTIMSGCQSDVSSLGLGNITASQLTSIVQSVYPTARQVMCLKDTGSGTMCVTEALDNIQAVTGTLTSTELETLVSQGSQGGAPNLPSNVTCSDCTKQAYNLIQSGFPGVVTTDMQNEVSQTCGASFIDGSSPSDVSETANTATQADTTSNGSPAQGMSVFGVALSSLFAASSAFALLA